MNILMCRDSTLIKIDETKLYTKNLLYFMQTNFSAIKQSQNRIILKYIEQEYFDRLFLIKWLYTLYSNITNHNHPDMKELLIKRIEKPIIVEFKSVIKKEEVKFETKEEFIKEEPIIAKVNPYQEALILLEIQKNDSKNIIRSKYKKLLREYHPDNVYNKGELHIQEYTDKFKSIQNAYDIININHLSA